MPEEEVKAKAIAFHKMKMDEMKNQYEKHQEEMKDPEKKEAFLKAKALQEEVFKVKKAALDTLALRLITWGIEEKDAQVGPEKTLKAFKSKLECFSNLVSLQFRDRSGGAQRRN